MPKPAVGAFLQGIPAPLSIGTIDLETGFEGFYPAKIDTQLFFTFIYFSKSISTKIERGEIG